MNETPVDHEFGGQHTELKLSIVEHYLQRYSAALHNTFSNVWYIDAFAGTGSRTVRVEARGGDLFEEPTGEFVEQRRGSARIALDIDPPFDRLIFMDIKPKHVVALEQLKNEYRGRNIDVLKGDANKLIQKILDQGKWSITRAVMFLDPYGMEVDWETLKKVASTGAIDVWYLFPLAGLIRQTARDFSKIDEVKSKAITRMLGTDAWKDELYSEVRPETDLLGLMEPQVAKQRTADIRGLEDYVRRRLATIFPTVLDPWPLPPRGLQRFSLFCGISNQSAKAKKLAENFGFSIRRSVWASHRKSAR